MNKEDVLSHIKTGVRTLIGNGGFISGTPFRPSQRDALLAYDAFLSDPSKNTDMGFFEMATGLGKTALFAAILREALNNARRNNESFKSLIIVPTTEILEKTKYADFRRYTPDIFRDVGLYGGDFKEDDKLITIITYESWVALVEAGKLDNLNINFVVSDEGHRTLSDRRVYALENNFPNAIKLGFSATSAYSPEKSLYETHENLIFRKGLDEGVRDGELAEYIRSQLYVFRIVPDKELKEFFAQNSGNQAEYRRNIAEKTWCRNVLNICKHGIDYQTGDALSDNKTGIYTNNTAQADLMERMLNNDPDLQGRMRLQGCSQVAVAVHSKQTHAEQRRRIKGLRAGEYGFMVGDKKFMEGFDYKPLKTIIDIDRGSELNKRQLTGRGTRRWWNELKQRSEGLTFIDTITYFGSDNPKVDEKLEKEARAKAVTIIDIMNAPILSTREYERKHKEAISSLLSEWKEKPKDLQKTPIILPNKIFTDSNVKEYVTLEDLYQIQNETEAFRKELLEKPLNITMDMIDQTIRLYREAYDDENPTVRSGPIEEGEIAGRMLWSTLDVIMKRGLDGLKHDPEWVRWSEKVKEENRQPTLHQRLVHLGHAWDGAPGEMRLRHIDEAIAGFREDNEGENPNQSSGIIMQEPLKRKSTWAGLRTALYRGTNGLSDDPEWVKWVDELKAKGRSPSLNERLITLGYLREPVKLTMQGVIDGLKNRPKDASWKRFERSGIQGITLKVLDNALARGSHGLKSDPLWQELMLKYNYKLTLTRLCDEYGINTKAPAPEASSSLLRTPAVTAPPVSAPTEKAPEKVVDEVIDSGAKISAHKNQPESISPDRRTVSPVPRAAAQAAPKPTDEYVQKPAAPVEKKKRRRGRKPAAENASIKENPEAGKEESFSKGAIALYLSEIGHSELLSAEEEIALARRVQSGDIRANKEFAEANVRLVVSIARRYSYMNDRFSLEDRISEGNAGLMRAIEKFDPKKEFRFSTYATWWIRQNIEREYMNQSSTIRIPIHVRKQMSKLNTAEREWDKVHPEEATAEELANMMGMSLEEVEKLLSYKRLSFASSLDAPIKDDEGATLGAYVFNPAADQNPENILAENDKAEGLANMMAELSPKQQEVIVRRFGLNGHEEQTLEQVGFEIGLTRERVRQIQVEGLRRLRDMFEKMNLDLSSFLEDKDADLEIAAFSSHVNTHS